jgi:hypothetical protein
MADPIVPNVVVSMPSQIFTLARSFKAAANGKIYIGQIDTDPTIPENQIQVYVQNEDDSLVPIAQPIIINTGGYPVYGGQIAKFVTVEGHSMAIYDAYNVQQFYFPNVLKYAPDMLRQQLASSSTPGASLVETSSDGSVQTVINGLHAGTFPSGYRNYTIKDRLDCMLTTTAMGAIGNGIADDTAAIQSAINTLANFTRSGSLYVDGRSKITAITIPSTLSLSIIGNNTGGLSYKKSALICTSTTGTVINATSSACSFKDLQIVGASNDVNGGGDTTQTAILFNPELANKYDCDAFLCGVSFLFFNKCVDLRGRNLKAVDCDFSNSKHGIWIGTTGIPDFRGLDVKNCRFHYMAASAGSIANPLQGSCIFIDPATNFFSIHLSGNYVDGSKWFYVGAMPWATIANNNMAGNQGASIYVYNTGSTLGAIFRRGVIQANTITGTNTAPVANDFGSIHIESGWGIDILGNSINNAYKTGIYNKAADSVINGNQIKDASFTESGGYYIRNAGNNAQVVNNTVTRRGEGSGVPAAAYRLETFTVTDSNRTFGPFDLVWDISDRGETLIYGEMKPIVMPSVEWGFGPPSSGRYIRGSIVYNLQPSPGGYLGWVSVGGTVNPGTWKGFGLIQS